ncbi:peptidyl-prolyl cis-trans isomerase, cyclophilin-type, partial [Ostertagia ostertagi]
MVAKPTRVFMDITADGRLVSVKHEKFARKQVRTFDDCAPGEKGYGYKGCHWYRIVPGFCAFRRTSRYSETKTRKGRHRPRYTKYFDDENHTINHNKSLSHSSRGILSMDNFGWPNTNSCRFFVTFTDTPWMDNFHVAFGELVEGFDVLEKMESYGILEGKCRGPKRSHIETGGHVELWAI